MDIKAEQKHIRITPQKLRLVADAVRDLPVSQAMTYLKFIRKRAAKPILKVYKQAIANAVNNLKLSEDNLKVKSLIIKKGSIFKRWQPVSRGRAHKILKRTSHIELILSKQKAKTRKASKSKAKRVKAKPKKITDKQAIKKARQADISVQKKTQKTDENITATQAKPGQQKSTPESSKTKIISSEGK